MSDPQTPPTPLQNTPSTQQAPQGSPAQADPTSSDAIFAAMTHAAAQMGSGASNNTPAPSGSSQPAQGAQASTFNAMNQAAAQMGNSPSAPASSDDYYTDRTHDEASASNNSWYAKGGRDAGNIVEGAGKEIWGDLAGWDELGSKIPYIGKYLTNPQTIAREQQRATTHNSMQNFGYNGMTLAEFVAGDNALEGLSIADRLASTSKIMKVLEGSHERRDPFNS